MGKNVLIIYTLLPVLVGTLAGCADNDFAFKEKIEACTSPGTSARNSDNPGPIIQYPPEGLITNGDVIVSGTCEPGFEVVIAGNALSESVTTACVNGQFSTLVTATDGDGTKSVEVSQATHTEMNIMDIRCFNKDTTPPVVEVRDSNAGLSTRIDSEISGICEPGFDVVVYGTEVASPVTVPCVDGTFSAIVQLIGPDGTKTVEVRQRDAAGNIGGDSEVYIKDQTPPLVDITNPAPMSLSRGPITVSGSCETNLDVVLSGAGITAMTSTPCNAGAFSVALQLSAGDGVKNLTAQQMDAAGNVGTDSESYVKDATPPAVAFTAPAMNTYGINQIQVQGTCEAGLAVMFSGTGVSAPLSGPCTAGTFNVTVPFSAGDGPKLVRVTQTDAAGNSNFDERTFQRDSTAPLVQILMPAANSVHNAAFTISGSCETGLPVSLTGGLVAPVSVSCVANAFSASIQLSAPDGLKTVSASQTDGVGLVGTDSRAFLRDTTGPTVIITAPAPLSTHQSVVNVQGSCENGYPVVLSGDVVANVSATCATSAFSGIVTLSAGDGTKNLVATQTDASGNVGTDNRDVIKDTSAPVVTILMPAANTATASSLNLSGQCENGLAVLLGGTGLTAPSSATCSGGTWSATVALASPDGVKNVVASQTDGVGNIGTDNRNFYLDTTAPVVSFTTPAAGSTVLASITVTGGCETGLTVSLTGAGLASDTSTACTANQFNQMVNLSAGDGSKNIVATQVDAVGNIGTANRTVIKDTTGPSVAITAPAPNFVTQSLLLLQGSCENGYPVTIYGAGSAATFNTACSSGNFSQTVTLSAGDGNKLVQVSQTDGLGLTGTDSRNFIKDTMAPVVTIQMPAANTATASSLTLSGQCENGLSVLLGGTGLVSPSTTTCSGGTWSSTVALASPDGVKNVVVAQTDAAGNIGQDNENFYLDTTAPVVSFTAPAAGALVLSTITVTGGCETGLTVSLSGTGIASSMNTACTASQFSQMINLSAGDGAKNIVATQVDGVGNIGTANRTVIKDSAAPAVAITAPAPNYVTQSLVLLQGVCENGYPVTIYGTGSAATFDTACSSGNFSQTVTLSAGDGNKLVQVSQTDGLGLTGTDSRNFIKDTTAPVVTIQLPVANTATASSLNLSGQCENGLVVNLSGTGLVSPSTTTCSGGTWTSTVALASPDGVKNVIASQTDAAGNTGTDNENYYLDTTAPVVSFTAPAAGAMVLSTITVTGGCETGLTVSLSGGGLATGLTTPCAASQFTQMVNLSAGDGAKNIIATQVDGVGNIGTANRTFNKNTAPPVVAITAPAVGYVTQSMLLLQGTCENGYPVTVYGSGSAATFNTACAAGLFSQTVTLSAGDGNKLVQVSQTNALGLTGTDSRNFVKDSTAPVINITAPAANSTHVTGVVLTGSCESGLTVNVSGGGIAAPITTACAASSFSVNLNFSAGDGAKTIAVNQTDAAGNTGMDSRTFLRDSTGPAISIQNPPSGTPFQSIVPLSGLCENGYVVDVYGTGVSSPMTTPCVSGTFTVNVPLSPVEGVKVINVRQIDGVGNSTVDSRSYVRDNSAPGVDIVSPVSGPIPSQTVSLTGSCETGLSVDLSGTGLTAPQSVGCSAGAFTATVTVTAGSGNKMVSAAQTDAAGNIGSDVETYILDLTAPIVLIANPADGTYVSSTVSLSGSCETGLTVNFTGTGVASPQSTGCTASAFSAVVNTSNGDGPKQVVASQTDLAGNTGSDTGNFMRDDTAPVVAFTNPAPNTTAVNGVIVQGTCEAGLNVAISGGGVATPQTVTCATGAFSANVVFSPVDGSKNVIATQVDAAGNTGTASRTFIKDATAPVVTITDPAIGTIVSSDVILMGACENGLPVSIYGTGVLTNMSVSCIAGGYSASVALSAGDGAKVVNVAQVDAAGNTGTDSRNFVKDSTPPAVAITAPVAGTSAISGLTVLGTCEAGYDVLVSGSGVLSPLTVTCPTGTFTAPITFSAGDGNKQVDVSQADGAGNIGTDSRTFYKDSSAPTVLITAPSAMTATQSLISLVGNCQNGLPVDIYGTGVSAPFVTTCSSATFTATVTLSAGDGTKNVQVRQTDLVGNVGTDSRDFLKDSTAPVVAFTSPSDGTNTAFNVTVQGTCENGLGVSFIGDIAAPQSATCTGGNFNTTITLSAGLGNKTITAGQTDSVGNYGSDDLWVVKTASSGFDSFNVTGTGKVDILFVNDNSASMDAEQAALGTRFPAFSNELTGVDWQMGMITTDCSTGPYGFCGSLHNIEGQSFYILDSTVPNYETLFLNTIQRPETLSCSLGGFCPSGREEPLYATIDAISKRGTDNAGFFRSDANLAVVILSDEDEQSNAPATATTAQDVVDAFNNAWPTNKILSVYGIVVQPGDTACLAAQQAQYGLTAFEGTRATDLALQTGGGTFDICSADYTGLMTTIGQDVKRLTDSFQLSNTPIVGSVSVNLVPAQSVTWSVNGNRISFDAPLAPGTVVEVNYNY